MIDQIYFYLSNVVNTSQDLITRVQKEFDPLDKIMTFLEVREKCPDFLLMNILNLANSLFRSKEKKMKDFSKTLSLISYCLYDNSSSYHVNNLLIQILNAHSNHRADKVNAWLVSNDKSMLVFISKFVISLLDYSNQIYSQSNSENSTNTIKLALEFIGNLYSDDNSHEVIEYFTQKNLAGYMGMLLDSEDDAIRRSVLWIYSNMVANPEKAVNE